MGRSHQNDDFLGARIAEATGFGLSNQAGSLTRIARLRHQRITDKCPRRSLEDTLDRRQDRPGCFGYDTRPDLALEGRQAEGRGAVGMREAEKCQPNDQRDGDKHSKPPITEEHGSDDNNETHDSLVGRTPSNRANR